MIRVKDLTKTYRGGRDSAPALHRITFQLPDTGFVCLVGPSGCGKTSLLNAMGGLDVFDSGTVSTDTLADLRCGSRLTEAERSRSFGYVFQNYYLLGEYSAAYNVWLGLHGLQLSHREKLERVMEALRAVDMERFARREVGQLSGGQQQRVAIARALARRPRVIFADEPTGNLDEANTVHICSLLRRISRTSLVVMVTHEMHIARFFADRIITLEGGRLAGDSTGWAREGLAAHAADLYAGDYGEEKLAGEGFSIRLLREEGAPPVNLTVVAEGSRILIKADDPRTAVWLREEEPPRIREGKRPVLRLEDVETDPVPVGGEADPPGRAGSGLSFPVLMREAVHLLRRGKLRQLGSRVFLAVLTALLLFSVGDVLKVASIDPEDFITADSRVLEVQVVRGSSPEGNTTSVQTFAKEYIAYLESSGLVFSCVPHVSDYLTYSVDTFLQMGSEEENLTGFSLIPLELLDGEDLILGRMPQASHEIVADRWVLEAMMERVGIIQSGITDVSYFLGRELNYSHSSLHPEIVGISDCGEPALFVDDTVLLALGVAGNDIIRLSDLQKACPGQFDGVALEADECIMITNNAGQGYAGRIGASYTTAGGVALSITDAVEADVYASAVVADEALPGLVRAMMTTRFHLCCEDKESVKAFIGQGLPRELEGMIQVELFDRGGDAMAAYEQATALRLDRRSIVILSVILLSLVMLCLLQRAGVQERIGMAAVYRLLGIPGGKLAAIFALEGVLLALMSVFPVGVAAWLGVELLSALPGAEAPVLLPWYWAAGVCLAVTAVFLLARLIPLWRLLRLPPARLAAKYDL